MYTSIIHNRCRRFVLKDLAIAGPVLNLVLHRISRFMEINSRFMEVSFY